MFKTIHIHKYTSMKKMNDEEIAEQALGSKEAGTRYNKGREGKVIRPQASPPLIATSFYVSTPTSTHSPVPPSFSSFVLPSQTMSLGTSP